MSRTTPVTSTETIESCRARILAIYESNPHVRLNLSLSHSKVVQDAQATIVGVYRHVFCVKETCGDVPQRHTFTFADLLTRWMRVFPQSNSLLFFRLLLMYCGSQTQAGRSFLLGAQLQK